MSSTRSIRLMPLAALLVVGAAACGTDTSADDPVEAVATTAAMADEMSDDMKDDEMSDDMKDDEMSDESMEGDHSDDEMSDDMKDDEMKDDDMSDDMAAGPEFLQLSLTDVDGNEFSLHSLMGTPVFVENFATWCPSCRAQLEDTQAAAAELGDEAVFVALSIETDLPAEDVAAYAESNGFDDVRFAVMTPEFLAAVSDHFGSNAINAPSIPHFTIDADGTVSDLSTGSEDSASIVESLHSDSM